MKKDIEWLKEEIGELPCVDTVFNSEGSSYIDSAVPVMVVYDLIDKLDEPEVLSQEWIDEHRMMGIYKDSNGRLMSYFALEDLQNLLVPKQEITFGQAHDKLREESILSEKTFDYYWNCINDNVEIDEPGNLLVPKQEELETKIHELIESYKQEEDTYSNPENGWISGFIEDLKNLVEEEQKYLVNILDEGIGAYLIYYPKSGNYGVTGVLDDSKGITRFTEQEIKDYDPRYWAFAKPVEELEE